MIRVLIVDDSPTFCHWLRTLLNADPELQVVGEARDGQSAIRLCKKLKPDVMTMDIQLPGMDGYKVTRQIMEQTPLPIIVLTSTASNDSVSASFKSMEAGAVTLLGKPGQKPAKLAGSEIVSQIKTMAGVKVIRRRPKRAQAAEQEQQIAPLQSGNQPSNGIQLAAIGTSTGGPQALESIFCRLSPDFCIPLLITIHISSGFVDGLAAWLNGFGTIRVKVAEDGERLEAGWGYLAPDDYHLQVSASGKVLLSDAAPVLGHRPSVTPMFESVARHYGQKAAGVLLTGMGRDGASGLKIMQDCGGYTIAQDEASSVVFGMPAAAIETGAAIEVLSLEMVAERLKSLCRKSAAG